MPAHNSLGPDDGYGVKNAGIATIEPNEKGPAGPTQMLSAWRALLHDIELMPQYQDFASSRRHDLKRSRSTRTKRKAIAIMRRSRSDSLLTASEGATSVERAIDSFDDISRTSSQPITADVGSRTLKGLTPFELVSFPCGQSYTDIADVDSSKEHVDSGDVGVPH